MPSTDIGLGAIVSLHDQTTLVAGRMTSAVTKLETKFNVAAGTITKAAKQIGIGAGLLVAGGLIRRGFEPAIKAAKDYQTGLAEVSTLTEGTIADLTTVSDELIRSSIALGQMPIESTKLLYQTISSGATEAATRLMVMQQAQVTATAGLADQNEVLDLLAAGVKSYGLEWSAVTEISDMAFQTVKLGKTTMGELAGSMQRTLASAAGLKVPLTELFGAFATLTGVTGDTAEVATQIRGLFTSLTKPTDEAKNAAKEMGIEWGAGAVKAKGLVGVLQDLRKATGGDITEIARFVPEARAMTGVLALVGAQADVFIEKSKQMETASGQTAIAFEKMSQTLGFAQKQWAAVRQAIAVTIGMPIVNALRPFLMMLTAIGKMTLEIAMANPWLIKLIDGFVFGASVLMSFAGAVLITKGVLLLLGIVGPAAIGALSGALKLFMLNFLPLLGMGAALWVVFRSFDKGGDTAVGGLTRLWEQGKLVWTGLSELMDSFTGSVGRMSKETADKLREAGLLQFTLKLAMLWARGKALFEGFKEGFVAAIDSMATSLASFLPKGSALERNFIVIRDIIATMGLDKSIADWKEFGQKVGFFGATLLITIGTVKLAVIGYKVLALTVAGVRAAYVAAKTVLIAFRAAAIVTGQTMLWLGRAMQLLVTGGLKLMFTPLGAAIGLLALAAFMVWKNRDAFVEFWQTIKETPFSQLTDEFAGWLGSMIGLEEQFKNLRTNIIELWKSWESLNFSEIMGELGGWALSLVGIGGMAEGTPRVPRDMVTKVHEGEAIIPKKFNPFDAGTIPVVAKIPGLDSLARQIALTGQAISTSPAVGNDLMAAPIIIIQQQAPGSRTAAGPMQAPERIELTVNLDGDVIHRSVVERERRASLRGGD